MTTLQKQSYGMSKGTHDAIVDQLRACHTPSEILAFEKWFDQTVKIGPARHQFQYLHQAII